MRVDLTTDKSLETSSNKYTYFSFLAKVYIIIIYVGFVISFNFSTSFIKYYTFQKNYIKKIKTKNLRKSNFIWRDFEKLKFFLQT